MVDLVNPEVADVDFIEIADTLASVFRWTGAACPDVSVAWHTLLGVEVAKERGWDWAIPWWLLHDAHEARLGDIATPVLAALDEAMQQVWIDAEPGRVKQAMTWLKHKHDLAIHAAAGLFMPGPHVALAVHQIDLICLMTERRDYLPDSPHSSSPVSWGPVLDAVRCHPRVLGKPLPPAVCAERLLTLFRRHLPALGGAAPPLTQDPPPPAGKAAAT